MLHHFMDRLANPPITFEHHPVKLNGTCLAGRKRYELCRRLRFDALLFRGNNDQDLAPVRQCRARYEIVRLSTAGDPGAVTIKNQAKKEADAIKSDALKKYNK